VSLHVPNQTIEKKLQPLCLVFAVWLIATSTVAAQPARVYSPDATGEWLVAKQIARIKIVDCDGRLWGVVAWEAAPGTDGKNPDPNLRTRPTLGMPILLGMQASKPNRWEGQIYNSQDGHTYSASITLVDPATLRVQGCFLGFLCGGENWTRVETQDTQGIPPAQKTPPKSTTGRKVTTAQPEPPEDVCSKVLDPSGLAHERGLK
jgi:uncharacterized protein (DUF2147 family)